MAKWIVRESSSGRVFQLSTKGSKSEDVYIVFAQQVLGMDTSGDFDTGNVDIDIEKVTPQKEGHVKELWVE